MEGRESGLVGFGEKGEGDGMENDEGGKRSCMKYKNDFGLGRWGGV